MPQVGIQFVVNQEYVRDKIDDLENQQKASFLDTLYRQFGNESFGKMKYLEFDYVRRKLDVSPNAVKKGLGVLQDHDHLLKFETIGELPLVRLIDERQSSLGLSKEELERHRNSLLKKLEYMKGYIGTETCREVYIRRYFGEEDVSACGHCDNCLEERASKIKLTDSDIRQIKETLLEGEGGKTFNQICKQFGWSKSQTKQSLGYLIREEKVVAEFGKYIWKDG